MEGRCLCGAIRYRVDGPPRRTAHCHCLHCRQSSGAPFITWSEFDPSTFRYLSGEPASYESRAGVTRRFCGRCGTQLTYQRVDDPDAIDVTTCSLDDAAEIPPDDHVWADRMLPWLKMDDGLLRYGKDRPRK
ncbi:MAG TPA: GFA family protein [Candidatus Saccharimonadales bacterium]|nr:GFA family protein [Candidatus Saccharimonadales bacterium]